MDGRIYHKARAIILLPSLSQSAWNTQFYFGHKSPIIVNTINYFNVIKCRQFVVNVDGAIS